MFLLLLLLLLLYYYYFIKITPKTPFKANISSSNPKNPYSLLKP
jgi:hypothetical protein